MEELVVIERDVTREVIDDFISFSKRLSDVNTLVVNKEYLTEKYLQSKSKMYELRKGDQTVGRVGIVFKGAIDHGIEKKNMPIAYIYDMYILPGYRSPFTNVVNLYRTLLKLNADTLILHTSNQNSEDLYRKLFRLPEITRLRIYCLPVFQWRLIYRLITALREHLIARFKNISNQSLLGSILKKNKLLIDDINGVEIVDENTEIRSNDLDHPHSVKSIYLKNRQGKERIKLKLSPLSINELRILVIYKFQIDKPLGFLNSISLFFKICEIAKKNECSMAIYALNVKSDLKHKMRWLPSIRIPESMMPHPIPIYAPNISKDLIDVASKLNIGFDEMDFI